MKKNGYTIAEAIITIGFIAIVATLVLPTFVSNYRKEIYTRSLQSAVANFEKAMETMINNETATDLFNTKAWNSIKTTSGYVLNNTSSNNTKKDFMNHISKTMLFESYSNYDSNSSNTSQYNWKFQNLNGSNFSFSSMNINEPARFKTPKGFTYGIEINIPKQQYITEKDAFQSGTNYLSRAANYIIIDVNSEKLPNRLGRDIFTYELSADGRLYPLGSKDHCTYYDITTNASTPSYGDNKNYCVNQQDGMSCAAYLQENGYKMDY